MFEQQLPLFGSREFNRLAMTAKGKNEQRKIAACWRDLLREELGLKNEIPAEPGPSKAAKRP